jgi:hypothetical protein
MRKIRKSLFTFLEVMIALSLLIMAAASMVWKIYTIVEKRQFQSGLEQLRSRFLTCRCLALNMQADWRGELRQENGKWAFTAVCLDHPTKKMLPPIYFHSLHFTFDQEKLDFFSIDFFSSGTIFPIGELAFYEDLENPKGRKETWKLPDIFQSQEGDGDRVLGPMHPDEF